MVVLEARRARIQNASKLPDNVWNVSIAKWLLVQALFFHSNLLHASALNASEKPRWALICCYNAASNYPYKSSHHPSYTMLPKVAEDAVLRAGVKLSRRIARVRRAFGGQDECRGESPDLSLGP